MTTPPSGGGKDYGKAGESTRTHAPDTWQSLPVGPRQTGPPAAATGTGAQLRDGSMPPEPDYRHAGDGTSVREQPFFSSLLQFFRDLLSNKDQMLFGLAFLILVLAVAGGVSLGLAYVVVQHVPIQAKISVGTGTTAAIAAGGWLIRHRQRKQKNRAAKPYREARGPRRPR